MTDTIKITDTPDIAKLIQGYNDAQNLAIQFNAELEKKLTPVVLEMYKNSGVESIQKLINDLPACPYRMKVAGIIAMMQQEQIIDAVTIIRTEDHFKDDLSALSTKVLNKDDKSLSIVQKLRAIEAGTNDSLNGVLENVGLGYSLEEISQFDSVKRSTVFRINGFDNENENGGLLDILTAIDSYNGLRLSAKYKDRVSISTFG